MLPGYSKHCRRMASLRGSDTLVEEDNSTSVADVGLVSAMPPNLAGKASKSSLGGG